MTESILKEKIAFLEFLLEVQKNTEFHPDLVEFLQKLDKTQGLKDLRMRED